MAEGKANLNLQLQANDLQVTGLRIVDGKLELSLSASLDLAALNRQLTAQLLAQTGGQGTGAALAGESASAALPDRSVPEFPDEDETDQPFPEGIAAEDAVARSVPHATGPVTPHREDERADWAAADGFAAREPVLEAEPDGALVMGDGTSAGFTADPEETDDLLDAPEFPCGEAGGDFSDGACAPLTQEMEPVAELAAESEGGLFTALPQQEFPEFVPEEELAGESASGAESAEVLPAAGDIDESPAAQADDASPAPQDAADFSGEEEFSQEPPLDARYGEPQPDIEWTPLLGEAPQGTVLFPVAPSSLQEPCGGAYFDPLLHTEEASPDAIPGGAEEEPSAPPPLEPSPELDEAEEPAGWGEERAAEEEPAQEFREDDALSDSGFTPAPDEVPDAPEDRAEFDDERDDAEFFAPPPACSPMPADARGETAVSSAPLGRAVLSDSATKESSETPKADLSARSVPAGSASPGGGASAVGFEPHVPAHKGRIKYVCPKCHTPGHQDIDRLGSIVTCSNCGRAMRLTMRNR